jgi:hypothetical protein
MEQRHILTFILMCSISRISTTSISVLPCVVHTYTLSTNRASSVNPVASTATYSNQPQNFEPHGGVCAILRGPMGDTRPAADSMGVCFASF